MTWLAAIASGLELLSRWAARLATLLAALAVGGIVLVLVFSSLQRYALAQPIPATEEIAAYLFVTVTFLSLVEGVAQGRHIRILPLWRKLPRRAQGWAMIAGHLGSLAILAIVIRETFAFARSSFEFGARSYVANLLEWPWMMLLPAALALLGLSILARLASDLQATLLGEPLPEAQERGEEPL